MGCPLKTQVNIVHHEMRFIDYLRLIKNETTLADFRGKAGFNRL